MDNLKLPAFVIIGAMKSGTSTIDRNLIAHSQIGFTKIKEPNFFNRNYHKGIEWYLNQFPDNKLILGDTSPNYSRLHLYPDTVRNIMEFNSEMKIIYIVRDPIDRIISQLHHNLYRDRIKPTQLERELIENKDYVLTSSYNFQIQPYLESFGRKNIKVITFENFIEKPSEILKDICEFLEVDYEEVNFKAYNTSEKKYLIKFHDSIHQFFGNNKLTNLYHLFWYFVSIKIKRPSLSKKSEIYLQEVLKDDIEQFKKTFTIDSSKWKTYESI